MAEFLLTNSNAAGAVFSYQLRQNISYKNAMIRVCNVLSIRDNYPSFKYLKNCQKLYFTTNLCKNELENDRNAIHNCILYEFLQNKPSGQSFQTFQSTLGEGIVEYKEFKRLFDRFERGDFEFKEGEFNDRLPNTSQGTIEKIVQLLETKNRLNLREVAGVISRNVDSSHLVCKKISMKFTYMSTKLRIEKLPRITYNRAQNGCDVKFKKNVKSLVGWSHLRRAMMDVKTIFKNQSLELETLKMSFFWDVSFFHDKKSNLLVNTLDRKFKGFEEYFRKLNRLVHVKSFDIQLEIQGKGHEECEPILSILPYLKPGFLEKIRIKMNSDYSEMMRKVVELDQWKQAIDLDMRDTPFKLPLQNLIHFKRFAVFVPVIFEFHVTWLAKFLSESDQFEYCSIGYPENQLDLTFIENNMEPYTKDESGSLLFKNQVSNAIFEMKLGTKSIDIIRKL